jgi:hypothetical protein
MTSKPPGGTGPTKRVCGFCGGNPDDSTHRESRLDCPEAEGEDQDEWGSHMDEFGFEPGDL